MPGKHISGFSDRQLAALEPYRIVQRRDGSFCVFARLPSHNIDHIAPLHIAPDGPPMSSQQLATLRRMLRLLDWCVELARTRLIDHPRFLDLLSAFETAVIDYLDSLYP